MTDPYRTQAAKPEKEEKPMSDEVRIWKMCINGLLLAGGLFAVAATADTALDGQTAKEVAASKVAEAKAIADRAMFEQMQRPCAEKK